MKHLKFPINFVFNIGTFSNDFTATDANGNVVAYVRQKMFKLKEDIIIFENENRIREIFRIRADKWIDFSAAYSITDLSSNTEIGKVARKGWRSLWKASYQLIDEHHKLQYNIAENNAWVKVFDSIVGEIPIIGFFTGYFLNPTYNVTNIQGDVVAQLIKEASFTGRKFKIEKMQHTDTDDDQRILLGLMMMILLERRRG